MIAFLGMGHLGANFTRALISKGQTVQVWNRTAAKARALEAYGARAFERVADAVKGADKVHVVLKDDQSVDEVLAAAREGLQPGAMIIDHTTTSVSGAVQRTEQWKKEGFIYLHAPVFMGPQNALESTGSMLVSGDQEIIAGIEPYLATMTGKVMNFGAETGKAAGMKLLGNLFLMAVTGGIADMLALAKAEGIAVADIHTLLGTWNPAAMVPTRLQKMTSGTFDQPTWELSMARKDAQLMMNEAAAGGTELMLIPAIASVMDQWIEKGHGNEDWTVIGKNSIPG